MSARVSKITLFSKGTSQARVYLTQRRLFREQRNRFDRLTDGRRRRRPLYQARMPQGFHKMYTTSNISVKTLLMKVQLCRFCRVLSRVVPDLLGVPLFSLLPSDATGGVQ